MRKNAFIPAVLITMAALVQSCNKEDLNVDPYSKYVPENSGLVFVNGLEKPFQTGQLADLVDEATTTNLKFGTNVLDENDVTTLQKLDKLESLDLTHVTFKSSGESYIGYSGAPIHITDDKLPEKIICEKPALIEVFTPYHVKSFGALNVYKCNSLKKVKVNDWVEAMDRYCFYACSGLTEVHVPGALKTAPDCFSNLSGIREITVPKDLHPSDGSFTSCMLLNAVTIESPFFGADGTSFFRNCGDISFKFGKGVKDLVQDRQGFVLNKAKSILLYIPEKAFPAGGTLELPVCREIAKYAMAIIDAPAVDVKFRDGLESVPNYCMNASTFASVELPASIGRLGECSVNFSGKLILRGTQVPAADSDFCGYGGSTDLKGIYVPAPAVENYKATAVWSKYADLIKPISE